MTPNSDILNRYAEVIGGDEAHMALVREAAQSVIYGHYIERYLQKAIATLDGDLPVSVGSLDPQDVSTAITMFAQAALKHEKTYAQRHPGVLENVDFREAISQLHANVAKGAIELLPPKFWMEIEEGRAQVEFANDYFSGVRRSVQLLLAGWNYADFTPSTMQTGEGLLSEAGFSDIASWTEQGLQQSMPHLVLSNMAMGEILKHIVQKMPADQALSVVDMGSGTGCTLAGVTLGISGAMAQGVNSPRVSITGIEGTLPFFETLGRFSDTALERMSGLGLEKRMLSEGLDDAQLGVETGQMSMIYGDILDTVSALQFSQEIQDGVLVVTANYVWHRLPSVVKKELIAEIARKVPNVIFLVADLVQNASAVNRGYFDLAPNGLLNCGNLGLERVFEENGFTVTPLNESTAPSTMNPELAKRIGQGTTSDSIFYMAYCGEKAARLLTQSPN